ncbi:MAG: hypothetical protein ACJ763_07095 [Bdellovibrionia bacterium]
MVFAILRKKLRAFCVLLCITLGLLWNVCCHASSDADEKFVTSSFVLQARIKKDGPRRVLEQVYGNRTEWESVLNQIQAADANRIKLAIDFVNVADAGAYGELTNAIVGALQKDPVITLSLAPKNILSSICSGMYQDGPWKHEFASAIEEVEKLKKKIEKSKLGSTNKAKLCLRYLEKGKTEIREYFDH